MASLHPSQDPRNQLIGPYSPSLRSLFSGVMMVHPRRDYPTRDPTTLMSGSRLSTTSTRSAYPLTIPMWSIHEHMIFPEALIRVFQGGKPPTQNDNTNIHLLNHSGSSIIRLLPVSAPDLKLSLLGDFRLCVLRKEAPTRE